MRSVKRSTARQPSPSPALAAARYTADFVAQSLPRRAHTILDVGCGSGDVAAHLVQRGYEVTGIDLSSTAVRNCRKRGIPAIHADFTNYDTDRRYDAILFSRSLHHVEDPRAILRRAGGMLVPRGVLLIEEFAFESVDEISASWLVNALRLLIAGGLANEPRHRLPREGRPALDWWKDRHHEKIHEGRQVIAAAKSCFSVAETEGVPYLFQYAVPILKKSAGSRRVLEQVRALELASFGAGRRPFAGIRAICRQGRQTGQVARKALERVKGIEPSS